MKNTALTENQKSAIARMEAHIESECSKIDVESAFNDMLDECYSFKSVGGIFAGMSPSRVLLECDPIAHRCGVNDYADSQRDQWTEVNGEYYETREVDKAREGFIDDLRDDLKSIEEEICNEDSEGEALDAELEQKKHAIEADIEACENHQF